MNPIVIRLSPRRIERLVLIILLLFFMSTTIYYSYKGDVFCVVNDTTATKEPANSIKESNASAITTTKTNSSSTTTELKSNKTDTAMTNATPIKNASGTGKIDITIGPLNYKKETSGVYEKAVVEKVTFIIKNGMSETLNMKVNIYTWDSSTPSDSAARTTPKDTLVFPTIRAGSTLANTYNVKNLNLYNFDLTKVITFEFAKLDGTIIRTETKYLEIV